MLFWKKVARFGRRAVPDIFILAGGGCFAAGAFLLAPFLGWLITGALLITIGICLIKEVGNK